MYVELFRNVPLIVQFFTRYLVIPELLPEKIGMWFKAELDPNIQFFLSSMLCPGLFTAARVCEQVRAAIQSLPRGQKNAALAMGLTLPQAYRYVLLPNAYRVIVPPMTSEMMNPVKNSAIASTIGLVDMAAQAGKLLDYSAHARESFTAITLAYVLINAFIMLVMTLVERKVRLPGNMGGGQIMYEFDWSSIVPSLPYLLDGLVITLKITVTAVVIGILWGTMLAVMRLSSFAPVSWFAKAYVNVFRSIPLVMVLLWFLLDCAGISAKCAGIIAKKMIFV